MSKFIERGTLRVGWWERLAIKATDPIDPVDGKTVNPDIFVRTRHCPLLNRKNYLARRKINNSITDQMNSTDGGPPPSTDFNHAITYVTKVKTRCAPTTYTRFLDILHEYKADILSIRDVVESMSTLFVGQPDLLQEFAYFLPEATQWMLQTPDMLQKPKHGATQCTKHQQ